MTQGQAVRLEKAIKEWEHRCEIRRGYWHYKDCRKCHILALECNMPKLENIKNCWRIHILNFQLRCGKDALVVAIGDMLNGEYVFRRA